MSGYRLKTRALVTLLLAGALSMAGWAVHSADQPPANDLVILEFKPSFDDLMTMIIQPRHIKLYYAAHEENWILAQFQTNELRAAFARVSATIPDFGVFPVESAFESTIHPALDDMDAALATRDLAEFERAYVGLTASCNACHEAMGFAFLQMKVPDAAPGPDYIDQDFRPVLMP